MRRDWHLMLRVGLGLVACAAALPVGAQGNSQTAKPPTKDQVLAVMAALGHIGSGPLFPPDEQPQFATTPGNDVQGARLFIARGQAALQSGHIDEAVGDFQRALIDQSPNGSALSGLAEAYTAKGRFDLALVTYRTLFYHAPGRRWSSRMESSPTVLMRFALVLLQTGHEQEAVNAYQRAAHLLNHGQDNGGIVLPVPLPELSIGLDAGDHATLWLKAMAHLGIGLDVSGHKGYADQEALSNFQEAVALAPNSAAAQYHLGKYLYGKGDPGAKTMLQRAVDLGDAQTAAAAKDFLQFLR